MNQSLPLGKTPRQRDKLGIVPADESFGSNVHVPTNSVHNNTDAVMRRRPCAPSANALNLSTRDWCNSGFMTVAPAGFLFFRRLFFIERIPDRNF